VEVIDEMEEIRNEYESMKLVPTVTLREMVTNPSLKFPLIISMMMMLAQQLSGINCVSEIIFFTAQAIMHHLFFITLPSVFNSFSEFLECKHSSLNRVEKENNKFLATVSRKGLTGTKRRGKLVLQAIFFSTQIFLSAGLTTSQSEYATIGMGAMNVCMTVLSLILVERAGRKTLLLIGLIGMFICTILLTICLILKVRKSSTPRNLSSLLCVIVALEFLKHFVEFPSKPDSLLVLV
jgi:hypothetical protein